MAFVRTFVRRFVPRFVRAFPRLPTLFCSCQNAYFRHFRKHLFLLLGGIFFVTKARLFCYWAARIFVTRDAIFCYWEGHIFVTGWLVAGASPLLLAGHLQEVHAEHQTPTHQCTQNGGFLMQKVWLPGVSQNGWLYRWFREVFRPELCYYILPRLGAICYIYRLLARAPTEVPYPF